MAESVSVTSDVKGYLESFDTYLGQEREPQEGKRDPRTGGDTDDHQSNADRNKDGNSGRQNPTQEGHEGNSTGSGGKS